MYEDNIMTFAALSDLNQPYSCSAWGGLAPNGAGLIVEDAGYGIHNLFNSGNAFPSFAFVDHNMTVHFKSNGAGTYSVKMKIEEMLEACVADGLCGVSVDSDEDGIVEDDNCPNDYNPDQGDSDGDQIGDECDDCHNLLGDINDDQIHDILDIVNIVNLILDGGMNSAQFTDCEKGDADINGDEIANILDIIQLINLILDNRMVQSNIIGKADVDFQTIGNDLHINIDSDKDFSGVQLSFIGDFFDIDLLNNSHIELSSKTDNGITRMLAYSLLNDSFDGHQATFIISNAQGIDLKDFDITIADNNGNAIVTTQSINSDVYKSGPYKFELSSIYPNPFNPSTEINFSVPSDSYVRLSVYNVQGQEVDVIHEGFQSFGVHAYTWNASNFSSGVYYVRLVSGSKAKTMKAVLMK